MNSYNSLQEIMSAFPGCTQDILVCKNCSNSNIFATLLGNNMSQYCWCESLVCTQCSYQWYLCKICDSSRQMSKINLRYHHKRYHVRATNNNTETHIISNNEMNNCHDKNESSDNFSYDDKSFNDQYNEQTHSLLNVSTAPLPKLGINTKFSTDHFEHFCDWQQKNLSLEYLMGKSNFDQKQGYENIDNYDAKYNLKVFEFVTALSQPLQEDFMEIINGMKPYMLKSSYDTPSTYANESSYTKHLLLPHNFNDLRRIHLRGKKSTMESIPQVPVLKLGKGNDLHSYVSIKKCIEHFLLFGGFGIRSMKKESNETTQSIFESRRCTDIFNKVSTIPNERANLNIIPFVMFSDDFDPSASLVKANRRGIWVYSCTFKNQLKNCKEIMSTYVLSIGNKGSNHHPVLQKIEKEINEVRSGKMYSTYHGKLNIFIKPVAVPILRHGDQPERRSINMLKLGKETNHARWRHSLDIKSVKDRLPSCSLCCLNISNHLKQNCTTFDKDEDILSYQCSNCSNWSFDPKYKFLHSDPPPHFPMEEVPINGKLPPLVLDKYLLKSAIVKTHDNVSSGTWSISTGKSFLGYYCLKTSCCEEILEHANNCYNLKIAEECASQNDNLTFIINDSKKYPEKYLPYEMSHIINCSDDDLDCFPDTPMHLISGFVKAILSLVMLFLKRKSCYNSFFTKISQDKHIDYMSSMKLSWLKVLPFSSEKFTGYACENYLSLSYILKFISFYLTSIEVEDNFQFPKTPQSQWTAVINRKWLYLRGLNTKGNAKTLKDRVHGYMSKNEEILVEKINFLRFSDIIRMIISCYNSIHLLLVPCTSEVIIKRTHLSLLRALNDVHYVDQYLRANKNNPVWHVKYNLICLLNCIDNMREYGPTKYRWEGSMEGEKCIQYLKKNSADIRRIFNSIYIENITYINHWKI